MVLNLKDVPRLLEIVRKFETDKDAKPVRTQIKIAFNNLPILEATYPNFDKIEDFCIKSGILVLEKNVLNSTELASKILDSRNSDYSINKDLKKIFVTQCFLKGHYFEQILNGLAHFNYKEGEELWASTHRTSILFSNSEILSPLYDCNLLLIKNSRVIVNPEYLTLVIKESKKKIRKKPKITQKQLEANLDHLKRIGDVAEEIVFNYEKKRLRGKKCEQEANNVQRISKNYANAGYDIKSFNSNAKNIEEHDRFIEVKGSTETKFEIHWSENEIKTARELGKNY